MRVTIESTMGNIGRVSIPFFACENVSGMEITHEIAKVMIRITMLPVIPAMRLPRAFIKIFCILVSRNPRVIEIIFSK